MSIIEWVGLISAGASILALLGLPLAYAQLKLAYEQRKEAGRQERLAQSRMESNDDFVDTLLQPDEERGVWTCGVYDYHPLSHMEAGKEKTAKGFYVELAKEVLKTIEKSPEFSLFSYSNFQSENHEYDMILGMFETSARSKRMLFSRPVHEIGLQGICRIDQTGDVLDQIREGPLKVAVYNGEVGWEFLNDELVDAVREHRVVVVNDGHQLDTTTHLKHGKYDVVLMDELSCINFLRVDDNYLNFKLAFPGPIRLYNASFAIKMTHQGKISAINAAIEEVRNSPKFLKMEADALISYESIVRRRALRSARK